MAFLWDLWVTISSPSEIIHLSTEKVHALGNLLHNAMSTLHPSFCGTIWDPVRTRISQIRYLKLTRSELEPKAGPRSEDDRDRQEETELKVAQDWIGKRLLFQDEYKINYRRISWGLS
jgi:hypothetical protein